jgi:hypothetical protein
MLARDTAASILQESGSLVKPPRMTVAAERPSGRLARYTHGPLDDLAQLRIV